MNGRNRSPLQSVAPSNPGSAAPRVPLLPPAEALEAAEAAGVHPELARLTVFQVLLQHPQLAKAMQGLLFTLLLRGRLDGRLRELVIMRLAWRTGSLYEWTQHWQVATEMGVPEEDLLAVRDWEAHPNFGGAERAVLAATDETLAVGTISSSTWAACEAQLGGRQELLELVVAIGHWRMYSSLLRSLEVPLESDLTPWPPDGLPPDLAGGWPGGEL